MVCPLDERINVPCETDYGAGRGWNIDSKVVLLKAHCVEFTPRLNRLSSPKDY